MKVKELIEQLQKMPQDLVAYTIGENGNSPVGVVEVGQELKERGIHGNPFVSVEDTYEDVVHIY